MKALQNENLYSNTLSGSLGEVLGTQKMLSMIGANIFQFRIISMMNAMCRTLISLVFLSVIPLSLSAADNRATMPDALYDGMVKFKLNSGDYFDALTMMDERYIADHPVDYTSALQGYRLLSDARKQIAKNEKQKSKLSDEERFLLGEVYYKDDDCINALRSFKGLKAKLSLEDKERWIFYRANCFIKLGSPTRAAKALRDIVGGLWASYAYYNLAMAYSAQSHDKTKALGTLWIADSLNKGDSSESKALGDKINLASGYLYLEGGKPDTALDFFRKVHLESDSSAQGLYLYGLAHMELGDFRAATQSWFSTKPYPVIDQSVAEAALAIPFAYDRSGYTSQSLEAYHEASQGFESELRTIKKVKNALEKHGARAILVDASEIKGLEWFLAKGVVKNTTRAAYYSYFVEDYAIHDELVLFSELRALLASIDYWQGQLSVYNSALKAKKSDFNQSRRNFDSSSINSKVRSFEQQLEKLKSSKYLTAELSKSLKIHSMADEIASLEQRIANLTSKVSKGPRILDRQLANIVKLTKRLNTERQSLEDLLIKLDGEITRKCLQRLEDLRLGTVLNYERAEQGLIHIMQGIAENKKRKLNNRRDGRSTR